MAKTMELSPRSTVLYSAVLLSITALLVFTFSELSFRYMEQLEKPDTPSLFRDNPYGTGSYRLKPGLSLTTKNFDERRVLIATNSHGMPWREVDKVSYSNRLRIAFVGDSFTFGSWADNFQSGFVGRFEERLSKTKYEILNFGVSGYGLGDSELLLKEDVSQFEPDYVVLAFFNGNDFRDTYLGVNKYNIIDGRLYLNNYIIEQRVPSEYISEHPETTKLEHPYVPGESGFKHVLRDNSATYRRLGKLKMSLTQRRGRISNANSLSRNAPVFPEELTPSKSFTSYVFWSQTPYPAVAEEAKAISLKTLEGIANALRDRNVTLLIISIPYREQVYVKKESANGYNIALPQKYVQAFAESHSIPYLDLLPQLRSYVRKTRQNLYVLEDPHFNNDGHTVVGEIVANWFNSVAVKLQRRGETPVKSLRVSCRPSNSRGLPGAGC